MKAFQMKDHQKKSLDSVCGGGRITPSWQNPRSGLVAGISRTQRRLHFDAFLIAYLSLFISGLGQGAAKLAGILGDRSTNLAQPAFVFSRAKADLNNLIPRRFAMNLQANVIPFPVFLKNHPSPAKGTNFSRTLLIEDQTGPGECSVDTSYQFLYRLTRERAEEFKQDLKQAKQENRNLKIAMRKMAELMEGVHYGY